MDTSVDAVPTARPPIPRSIWVLIAAAFVIAIGYGLVAPVLPQYARSFDVGVTAASVIVSIFAFFRLVFAPMSGRLVVRLGERPVYLWGLGIVAVSTGASAFAANYWQLLLFRGLGGIGSTMFTVSAMGLLVRLADPRARGRISGLYASAFLLGNIMGPGLGGLLAEVSLAAPFLVYGVALLIAMAVVAVLLRDVDPAAQATGTEKPAMTLGEGLRHPTYRAALASNFANGWASFGVRVALVPLFVIAIGLDNAMAGAALALYAVGNAIAVIPAGRLADSRGRKPLVLTGLVVAGATTMVLGTTSTGAALLVVCVIAGMGTGLLNAPQQAAVADVIGAERSGGTVLAAFQMVADVGAISGPILAGLLAEYLSFEVAFLVTGAILLLSALPWLAARETLGVSAPGEEKIG